MGDLDALDDFDLPPSFDVRGLGLLVRPSVARIRIDGVIVVAAEAFSTTSPSNDTGGSGEEAKETFAESCFCVRYTEPRDLCDVVERSEDKALKN